MQNKQSLKFKAIKFKTVNWTDAGSITGTANGIIHSTATVKFFGKNYSLVAKLVGTDTKQENVYKGYVSGLPSVNIKNCSSINEAKKEAVKALNIVLLQIIKGVFNAANNLIEFGISLTQELKNQ